MELRASWPFKKRPSIRLDKISITSWARWLQIKLLEKINPRRRHRPAALKSEHTERPKGQHRMPSMNTQHANYKTCVNKWEIKGGWWGHATWRASVSADLWSTPSLHLSFLSLPLSLYPSISPSLTPSIPSSLPVMSWMAENKGRHQQIEEFPAWFPMKPCISVCYRKRAPLAF